MPSVLHRKDLDRRWQIDSWTRVAYLDVRIVFGGQDDEETVALTISPSVIIFKGLYQLEKTEIELLSVSFLNSLERFLSYVFT